MKAIAVAALVLVSNGLGAQVLDEMELGPSCSMFGEALPESVTLFESETEAEDTIEAIVEASGIAQNFTVRAAGVPNAAAVIRGEERFVLYEPYFMKSVREQTGTKWAAISIMAHEIGHHLNGHTLRNTGSRPKSELEADYFSGFILQKLGASLDESRKAMQAIGSPTASDTHPAKNDRLVSITQGWNKACKKDSRCSNEGPDEEPNPTPRRERTDPPRPRVPSEPAPAPPPQPVGFPRGYATSACGCWGYVNLGASRVNRVCASGFDMAQMCPGWCMGGGSPWQSVCM